MQLKLKTILNLKESHSHFVYEDIRLAKMKQGHRIEVSVRARQGSFGICSCCSQKSAGYDRLSLREFIHAVGSGTGTRATRNISHTAGLGGSSCAHLGIGGCFVIPHATGKLSTVRDCR